MNVIAMHETWLILNWPYTLRVVTVGTMVVGFISGFLGTFIVLRKQALVGDALSHAALPGVVIAFMLTQIRELPILLIGAAVASVVAMLLLNAIKRRTRVKFDAGMALILSGFFGLGQVLISHLQKTGSASQAGLSTFIFGQAASMVRADVVLIILVSLFVFLLLMLFWKELKLYIFDEPFYRSVGLSERVASGLLTITVVLVVVIGIRTIGVVLMSALLIAPSVAARQLSNRFLVNATLAGLIGASAGAVGTYVSYVGSTQASLPTGPVVVMLLSGFVLLTMFFSWRRGIVKHRVSVAIYRRQIIKYKRLIHLYEHGPIPADQRHEYEPFISRGTATVVNNEVLVSEKGKKRVRDLIEGGRQ